MKLNEWLSVWLEKYTRQMVKHKTYYRYKYFIEKHINPKIGSVELEKINGEVLQEFITSELQSGNLITKERLANNTVIGIFNILKQSLSLAYSLGKINNEDYKKINKPSPVGRAIEAFEREDQQRIERYCLKSKKNNYKGILVCLYTGIRIGELLALTWDDIDFQTGIMSINKTAFRIKIDGKPKIVVDEPKTKDSNRIIPVPKALLSILNKVQRSSTSNYVISTRAGGMVSTRAYQRTFQNLLRRIRVHYRNFHTLRHTFATRAIEMGMDVKTLSEILGHKNPMITLRRYTHSMMSYKISMMNKLGRVLYPQTFN